MKALIHSGGASKGAYGCGVISYLMGELQTDYQLYCGNSVGAINTAFLAQFPVGQEIEAATQMKNWWLKLDDEKIYTRWKPFGRLHSIWKQSVYDSTPLQKLVRENISLDKIRFSGKKISVGAVSISSGKYITFDQDDDDFVSAVLASSAFPGLLAPIKMKDQWFMDAGVQELSPIRTAIEMGATEIDVITSSPEIRIKKFIEKPGLIDILKRIVDLFTDKILENDIERALMYNKLAMVGATDKKPVEIRIFRPHNSLLEDTLNFDPQKIAEMIETGYEDAKRIVGHSIIEHIGEEK